jgi:tetratricopeptide (TPR) repeat protein
MKMAKFCLAACLLMQFASALAAGIYSPGDEAEQPIDIQRPPDATPFRQRLVQLGSLATMPVDQPLKEHYLQGRQALESRLRQGRASKDDRLALSAIMMRLGESAQAMSLLRDDPALLRGDALAAAQLSTLLAMEGKYEDAAIYCRQALDAWPRERPPYTPAQLRSCKRSELYCFQLYRSRARDRAKGATTGREPDDLFGLRFTGTGGTYTAGRLTSEEAKKLPEDVLGIVEQLLLWMPGDTRLYWQYGELLNAKGDTSQAAQVMDECLWNRRYDAPLLRQHRQILREAVAAAAGPSGVALPTPEPSEHKNEPGHDGSGRDEVSATSWRIDRGLVMAVGVLAAMVAGYLAYQQVRESRRKRQKRGA